MMKTTNFQAFLLKRLSGYAFMTAAILVLSMADIAGIDLIKGGQVFAQDDEEGGRRAPPEARSSQTLGRRVFTRINEVMELRDMEQYSEALAVLDEVKQDFDRDRLSIIQHFINCLN